MARSNRTRELDVSPKVRAIVYERDSFGYPPFPCCVTCGKTGKQTMSHFIKRSQGGLGIEENLINQCIECHQKMEMGDKDLLRQTEEYLQEKYPDWEKSKLVYERWGEEWN